MTENKIAYLRPNKIVNGMFKGEKGVCIKDIYGNEIGGFFPDEMIKDGKLEVFIVEEIGNKALITTRECSCGFLNNSCVYVYKNLLSFQG